MNPAIVVCAYNRPQALARLLKALSQAAYPDGDVPLVISIDRSDDERSGEVARVAEQFEWPSRSKRVIHHDRHLGLVEHVFFCGGLAAEYGAVVFLEDDLGISPVFYPYASQALACYGQDDQIAGISLYSLWFNGYTRQPFVPYADGSDVFFVQVPYTQGQAWTQAQWKRFADWRARGNHDLSRADGLHDMFLHFGAAEWFPRFTQYVVETGQYYVYPRVSLATGMGDSGTHFSRPTSFLQVPLQHAKEQFTFKPFGESLAVYDAFFEIRPERLNRLTGALAGLDYDVDLYATKRPRHLHAEYTLTTRRCRAPLRSFGKTMWPQEINVVEEIPGSEIVLCKRKDVRWDWLAELETRKLNHDYFTRRQRLGKKAALQFALLELFHNRFSGD